MGGLGAKSSELGWLIYGELGELGKKLARIYVDYCATVKPVFCCKNMRLITLFSND